ncbi:hypothetical protein ES705_02140 [subsurface metagenome]|nr:hypothetical protein [Clostridia bacterium]
MNRIIKAILKVIVILGIFYFLGRALYRNWSQIDFKQLHFNVPLLIVSMFFLFGFFLMFAFGWKLILKELGVSLPFLKSLKIIFYSQLGKYLPGKIWTFAGRMYLCQKIGISTSKTFISMALEMALTTISGILIFLASLLFSSKFRTDINPFLLATVAVLVFVIIHPKVLVRIINFFLRLIKKEQVKIELNFSQILMIMAYYCIIWLCFGIAFYFLINSVTFITPSKIPIITGSFAIASTIGLIALFAPAGLGVREGILSLLLSNFFPLSLAILLSFLCRIWVSVGELLAAGISTRIKL